MTSNGFNVLVEVLECVHFVASPQDVVQASAQLTTDDRVSGS